MFERLAAFAIGQRLFIVIAAIGLAIAGVRAFFNLPIEAFPDVSDIQVNVIALYPGRAPEEVEKQVTIPLEIVLSGLPHQVRMFSHTQFGLSFIMLTFDDKVTAYFVRQQVLERLQGADLPPGVPGSALSRMEMPRIGPASGRGRKFKDNMDILCIRRAQEREN